MIARGLQITKYTAAGEILAAIFYLCHFLQVRHSLLEK